MEDTPAKENPEKDFNKIDLSQLQGFSFGTQWTQDKTASSDRRERTDRPRRESGPSERRDRRAFRRPAGEGGADGDFAGGGVGVAAEPRERREYPGERGPRQEFRGPRRDGPAGGERGAPRAGGFRGRGEFQERGPYDSPFFSIAFYPEDTSFNALAKTIRSSCRTIELFEIARTVIGKIDRFVVVLNRKMPEGGPARSGDRTTEGAPAAIPTAKKPLYLAVPDGMPFDTEEAAVAHVLANHLGRFFDLAEVEIEPPKGNFQVINKCGITGELLGPPNYHRYAHIVQQHHAAKVARMSFEAFRSKIETVRDPEIVNQWLEKMKKTTRYTWKQGAKAVAAKIATEPATPAIAEAVAEVAVQEGSTTPETAPAITFDNFEDARTHLLTNAREKVVRAVEHGRFHGKLLETMPPGEIRRAIEGALERQRRFPLDTANALRGRLRREHFTIFKKGSKGISYVCAVKRKFRVPGQTFADSISALITYIEANPMIRASALSVNFLGIKEPAAEKPAEAAPAPAETGATITESTPVAETNPAGGAPAGAVEPTVTAGSPATPTIEQLAKISRMQGDLRWLVTEGYVTEFIDGRLFAPPPMVEARKKEIEGEENDPENFPEAPGSNPPFEAAAATAEPPAAVEEAPAPEPPTPAGPGEASSAAPTGEATVEPAPSATETPAGESEPSRDSQASPEPEAVLVNAPAEPEVKPEAAASSQPIV